MSSIAHFLSEDLVREFKVRLLEISIHHAFTFFWFLVQLLNKKTSWIIFIYVYELLFFIKIIWWSMEFSFHCSTSKRERFWNLSFCYLCLHFLRVWFLVIFVDWPNNLRSQIRTGSSGSRLCMTTGLAAMLWLQMHLIYSLLYCRNLNLSFMKKAPRLAQDALSSSRDTLFPISLDCWKFSLKNSCTEIFSLKVPGQK